MKAQIKTGTISIIFGYRLTDNLLLVGNFPTLLKTKEIKNQSYSKRLINKKYNHKVRYCK